MGHDCSSPRLSLLLILFIDIVDHKAAAIGGHVSYTSSSTTWILGLLWYIVQTHAIFVAPCIVMDVLAEHFLQERWVWLQEGVNFIVLACPASDTVLSFKRLPHILLRTVTLIDPLNEFVHLSDVYFIIMDKLLEQQQILFWTISHVRLKARLTISKNLLGWGVI